VILLATGKYIPKRRDYWRVRTSATTATPLGHTRESATSGDMSALPYTADTASGPANVRYGPLPDIADGYIGSSSTPENSKWPE
jgi:hypothetical protein